MTNFLDVTSSTAAVITTDGYATLIDSFDLKTEIDDNLGIPYSFFAASCELFITAIAPFDGYAANYQFGFGLKSTSYPDLEFIETSTPTTIVSKEDAALGWVVTLNNAANGILEINVQGTTDMNIYWRSLLKLNIDVSQIPS